MGNDYVHGYSATESTRLTDQATTLTELLHADTRYPPGSLVLEAGCGVGAQTVILAGNSPDVRFTSVDLSEESLAQARRQVQGAGFTNVAFRQANIFDLPFPEAHFDHVFVCFVLEHLSDPAGALEAVKRVAARAGVSASTVTRVEKGEMDPTVKMLERLLEAAGADLVIELRQPPPTPTLEDVEAHTQVIQEIVSRHGGSNVRVVGSVSRGEAPPGSDVDLLVDIEPGTGLVKVVQMEQELADALPWPVDVITSGAAHGRMAGVVNEAVPL